MSDYDFFMAATTKEIAAEDLQRGEAASCLICWSEHDREVTHKSKAGALRHLRTVHPWYWRVRKELQS